MRITHALGRALAAAVAGMAAVVVFAGAALAGPTGGTATQHWSWDPAGSVFTCGTTDVTVTGGTIDQVMHATQDAREATHVTIGLTMHEVTATDAAGNDYVITGASHTTAITTAQSLQQVNDSSHFVIRGAAGVLGHVQLVDHYDADARSFTLDFGGCQAPQN